MKSAWMRIVDERFQSQLQNVTPQHLCPLIESDESSQASVTNFFYDSRVEDYDRNLHITFDTHGLSEAKFREELMKRIEPSGKVILELGSGTGRDSLVLLQSFENVSLVMLEPAPAMMHRAIEKVTSAGFHALAVRASAEDIPLQDQSVDAVYSFGGFNEFRDPAAAMREIVRVCKPGSNVLLADEGIPIWWRDTDFFKILNHTNPQFSAHPPLQYLPIEARDTNLSWAVGETFWVLHFTIGEGPPLGNFDIAIPGKRGGTLASRYLGKVEGVTPSTRSRLTSFVQSGSMSEHEVVETALTMFLDERGSSKQSPQHPPSHQRN